MAVDITITGLTNQQLVDIRDAFVATQGPVPDGLTQSQFTKLCILRFIRSVVKGWKRGIHEAAISSENSTVDTSFGDEVV
jgi:hypothetical protein